MSPSIYLAYSLLIGCIIIEFYKTNENTKFKGRDGFYRKDHPQTSLRVPPCVSLLFGRVVFLDGTLLRLFGLLGEVFEQRTNVEKTANRNDYRKPRKKNKTYNKKTGPKVNPKIHILLLLYLFR
jgi:hypothetical protein